MADPFTQALVQVLVENVNTLIQKEIGLLFGVNEEIVKLSSILSAVRAVLADAEEQQLHNRAMLDWLQKLDDAAHEADDVLDEFATKASRFQHKHQDKVSSSPNIWFRRKIGKKIKNILRKLDAIADEHLKFNLNVKALERREWLANERETCSVLSEPQVYGRSGDKEKIIGMLLEDVDSRRDVSVLPIVGMGGLGKTTLAQYLFNDQRVVEHFDPRIWVCVSDPFDLKKVIISIIELALGRGADNLGLETLQRNLQECVLKQKRYLLVLDDVWNEDQEKWLRLLSILSCGSNGASVITTTRSDKVASIMGTLPVHKLSSLSEDDCWLLFKQRAFGRDREEKPNLVAIGKEVVKKCGGVPLAAKALGGLLRFKNEETEWESVKNSEIWELPEDDNNSILPALKLSYDNLPLALRQCFAYCALFPKDSIIEREKLINMWIANGFISSRGNLDMGDAANGLWNELHWRSFFQDVEMDEFGDVTHFKMHDLVHDLAEAIMKGKWNKVQKDFTSDSRVRQATLYNTESNKFSVAFPKRVVSDNYSSIFTQFTSLRVLDASNSNLEELPPSIGNLVHLRYLDLSSAEIQTLPDSVCRLVNLQTLNLYNCQRLKSLPENTSHLRNLRHLNFEYCWSLREMPPKIGKLNCLRTLGRFIVGEAGKSHASIAELRDLSHLRGMLGIDHLERVKSKEEARGAKLYEKKNLRQLSLQWNWGRDAGQGIIADDEVLESLEPAASSLLSLQLWGYRGACFPRWVSRLTLENVVTVYLYCWTGCSTFPPLEELPHLRVLAVKGFDGVEYLASGVYQGRSVYPSLESLIIGEFPNLKGLFVEGPSEEGRRGEEELMAFPRLRKLEISSGCPLLSLTCLPSLQRLAVSGSTTLYTSLSSARLSALTSLRLYYNDEVISFPQEMLQNLYDLRSLRIIGYCGLKELPTSLANLTALEKLSIEYCPELETLPEQGLQGLISLTKLSVRYCKKLKSLSEGLGKLTCLETLEIEGCPELVDLPRGIGNKRYRNCEKLKSLSEGWGTLLL